MKISITKTKEYTIPNKATCTYLDARDLIRECEALKKDVWIDSDGYAEDMFYCRAFEESIGKTKEVGKYRFPVKIKICALRTAGKNND